MAAQCILGMQDHLLKFKLSIRKGKKVYFSDLNMVVGAGQAGLSISENDDLLGFLRTAISRVYRE